MFSALLRRGPRLHVATAGLMAGSAFLPRQPATSASALDLGHDPHLWLEEIEGDEALAWCRAQNERSVATVGDPEQSSTYRKILAIADAKDKIPYVGRIGGATGDEAARVWYNFWQDAEHPRGLWRRTSLASYRMPEPEWEEVLDLDGLNTAEGRKEDAQFVWHGYSLLDEGLCGAWDRALVCLSPGGTDAQVVREFDLSSKAFVDGGFRTDAAAKCDVGFRRRDEVLIGTDFDGDGATLTDSGYPRVVRSWLRGTPLETARTVFEVEQADLAASQYCYRDRGGVAHEFRLRQISFYKSEQWYRSPDLSKAAPDDPTPFVKLELPDDVSIGTFGDQATLELRSAWAPPRAPGGRTYPAGTLLSAPLGDVLRADWSRATALFEPAADGSSSLAGVTATCNYLVLHVSEHVRTRLGFHRYAGGGKWTEASGGGAAADAAAGVAGAGDAGLAPAGEAVSVSAIWPDDSDELWVHSSGFLHPSTLAKASADDGARARSQLKSVPPRFDGTKFGCWQHFATSADGTRVPYFLLGPKDLEQRLDGRHPTLLDGYGGFEISLTPYYSGAVGVGWLERGGVKAIANIRGGGEYARVPHASSQAPAAARGGASAPHGRPPLSTPPPHAFSSTEPPPPPPPSPRLHRYGPRWHQAALREKRHKAYEDFEAVGRDLVRRGVCSPETLGCIGGSNGGLLIGNMLTREGRRLFGAAVCQVPLLDMKRYHTLLAGASWMEEYGDPDAAGVWEGHLRSISPLHRLRGPCFDGTANGRGEGEGASPWAGCPTVLFTTSTKDDRVHPGHARKMVKALLDEIPTRLGGGLGNVFYWENIEGGHGGAADNKQRSYMWALTYDFLWWALVEKKTGDDEPRSKFE